MISDLIFGNAFNGPAQFAAFLISVAISFFIASAGAEAFRISRKIANRRFTVFFYKVALALAAFFVLRILADLIDRFFDFTTEPHRSDSIAWFSLTVNVLFWALICFRIWSARRALNKTPATTIEKFSSAFDDLLTDMAASKRKATEKLREIS